MGACLLRYVLLQIFSSKHLIALEIFINCLLNNIFWQCPVISRMRGQPVTGKLLVKGWLGMTGLIAVCRPETGAVRGKHFITKDNIPIFIQTELKLGISNDDTFA